MNRGSVMVAHDPLLKTRQVASALGLSVSTIKRWVDSGKLTASRTVGRHRLIRLSETLRFAREQGLPHAELERLLGGARVGAVDGPLREALVEALREGRGAEAKALIHAVQQSGLGAVVLADELIRPVMERIGHGWMVGSLDVFQEHQATYLVASALTELIARVSTTRAGGALAVGATSAGDPYILPGLLAELVLGELGWEVRNLGVNLPLRSLARAVVAYRPRLAYLSVNHRPDPVRFVGEYASFYEAATRCGVAVIVGGRGLLPEVRARLMYASYGDRMAHLAEFARRLSPSSHPIAAEGDPAV